MGPLPGNKSPRDIPSGPVLLKRENGAHSVVQTSSNAQSKYVSILTADQEKKVRLKSKNPQVSSKPEDNLLANSQQFPFDDDLAKLDKLSLINANARYELLNVNR